MLRLLVLATVACFLASHASAQVIYEDREIRRSDGDPNDRFGSAVATGSMRTVVAAERDGANGPNSGSAFVFPLAAGEATVKLLPADGAPDHFFGASIGVSGSLAIVGAWGDDDKGSRSGSAYIFDVLTGTQLLKLTASDGQSDDFFGLAAAIDGGIAVVGAYGDDDNGPTSGSAYLFNASTGAQLFKLIPSDPGTGDQFGGEVAISGTRAIVSAFRNDDSGTDSGAAYIFDTTSGAQLLKLLPSDGAADDNFGLSVAISGNIAAVGAPGDDDLGASSGSVYLFDAATGTQLHKITAPDGVAGDLFGSSVAVTSGVVVVGAYGADPNGTVSGTAYLFDTLSGALIAEISAPDNAALDAFGVSVAIHAGTVIVGANGDDDNGSNSGSAHAFSSIDGSHLFKLLPTVGTAFDSFGFSVGLEGSTGVVGAYGVSAPASSSGAAYVIDTMTAVTLVDLFPSDPVSGAWFGFSVDIAGGKALVGAPSAFAYGVRTGAAYLFNASSGAQTFKLEPPTANDRSFGRAVALEGDIAVVGSPRTDIGSMFNAGRAYVYDASTGALRFELVRSDPMREAKFGSSVDASATAIAVGAWESGAAPPLPGAVYIFDASTGGQIRKLTASDGAAEDYFGYDVAISDTAIVVGAPYADPLGSSSGAVYVFDALTGSELFKLVPADGAANDWFGFSVAISGSVIVVGASLSDDGTTNSGSAYVFDLSTGQQIAKLRASNGSVEDYLGTSVSLSGSTIYVGAYGRKVGPSEVAGSTYVFTLPEADCPGDLNNDGEIDVLDFLDFFDAFGQCDGQPAPCPDESINADFNGDTFVDVLDFLDFFDAFGVGVCP